MLKVDVFVKVAGVSLINDEIINDAVIKLSETAMNKTGDKVPEELGLARHLLSIN